jgi:anti-anti-sigma regulatory factor
MEVVNKAQEIHNKPARNLIIDLSEVTSVSTTGLVALHKIALVYSGAAHAMDADAPTKERRPDFTHHSNARKFVKLLNPQPDVEKALEKAGMKLFFKVYKDLESAIESF